MEFIYWILSGLAILWVIAWIWTRLRMGKGPISSLFNFLVAIFRILLPIVGIILFILFLSTAFN